MNVWNKCSFKHHQTILLITVNDDERSPINDSIKNHKDDKTQRMSEIDSTTLEYD